jgi:hypothetical protein
LPYLDSALVTTSTDVISNFVGLVASHRGHASVTCFSVWMNPKWRRVIDAAFIAHPAAFQSTAVKSILPDLNFPRLVQFAKL